MLTWAVETKDVIIPDEYEISTTPDEFYSSGVVGCKYQLWTKRSFPLNVELNIRAGYMKEGKTKYFETPGKGKFINYKFITTA
jgi:hypothetical protein